MKKRLGALVLALTAVVLSAACATSGGTTTTTPKEPTPGEETWAKAAPSELPSRPGRATAVHTERLASR